VGPHDTPLPEARIPGTDVRVSQHPKSDLGNAKIVNGDRVQGGIGQASEAADDVVNGVQDATMDSDNKKRGLVDKVRDLRVRDLHRNRRRTTVLEAALCFRTI
jgi:hypothetical protein